MTTFGLVHGAWHGAWCWERVVPELEARGHRAVAVELPAEDTGAGCARYAEVVVDALREAEGDVVLVGHSLGGLTIPLVAAARPVRRLVFLCALLPQPRSSLTEQLGEETVFSPGWSELASSQISHDDGSSSWPEEAAVRALYHDCPPHLALHAARRLRRQVWLGANEASSLSEWPDVESNYILCTADRCIDPAWAREAARRRLGVTALELPGGHSPMLSRPAALADALTASVSAHGASLA